MTAYTLASPEFMVGSAKAKLSFTKWRAEDL